VCSLPQFRVSPVAVGKTERYPSPVRGPLWKFRRNLRQSRALGRPWPSDSCS
jgi:hypothetical protein